MSSTILVGVAWPYANGPVHLGHIAGCYLPADEFSRYQRMQGNKVLMVSGTDEHGTPITVRAQNEGVTPAQIAQRYHDEIVESFNRLSIQWDIFTCTRTENHAKLVQKLFLDLYNKGLIVKQPQQMLYCPEENQYLPDRYVEGICPHCGAEKARGDQCDACGRTYDAKELQSPHCKLCGAEPIIKETEHFFFRWSAFNDQILEWLKDKTYWRSNVTNFANNYLREGLKDTAITRDMEWGISVPIAGYENKRIYVWWEAVIGYLSASVEWSQKTGDPEAWKQWWHNPECRSYYFIGKDNIPFHAIRWPAVLMGCEDLVLPYDVPANEFLNLEGRKISTSENWAVWANDILDRYDPDAVRYVLTAIAPETSDADFSWSEFLRRNNDELVGWWGNLVNRSLTFTHKHFEGKVPVANYLPEDLKLLDQACEAFNTVGSLLDKCQFRGALAAAMDLAREGNRYFDTQAPWKLVKVDKERTGTVMATMVNFIAALQVLLTPFLPNTCATLHEMLGLGQVDKQCAWQMIKLDEGHQLGQPQPLFKKLDASIVEEERARLGK